MSVVRYYGAKPDTYDHRDQRKVYSQAEIPSSRCHPKVNLSKFVVSVYNQGRLGSCTANALCGTYALDLEKQSETRRGGYEYFTPSRLFLYYNTREYEGTEHWDAGASIRDTVKALNRQGVCEESEWPYDVRKYTQKPPRRCYDAAKGNTLCKYERLLQDAVSYEQRINQLRACLKDNCPFVFGFKVYDSFDKKSNRLYGNMPKPTWEEKFHGPVGLHAVAAVGYDDRNRHIIVLNSWGSDWGDNGYFYMPYEFITDSDMCFDFWKIAFACQRDKPRPKDTMYFEGGSGSGGYSASGSRYSSSWAKGYSTGYSGACGYGSSGGKRWC